MHTPLSDQNDQRVVRNGRKVAAEINLYHAPRPLIQVIANRLGGHLRISLWAVTVGARMKVGLEDRLQHQLHRSLYYAVSNLRYPERTGAPFRFRDIHPPHRMKAIALGPQLVLQLTEHFLFFSTRLNPFDSFSIHPRRPP